MRLLVPWLVLPVAGCSLIYNPSDLPNPAADARFDAPDIVLDADPSALALVRVAPTTIFEGTGTGGARKGLLVVEGMQLVKGATISVTAHDGTTDPMITLDEAATDVSDNGFHVAVPFTVAVNPSLAAGTRIRLDVKVVQPTGSGDVDRTLTELPAPAEPDTPVLELLGLDELESTTAIAVQSGEYSQVTLAAGVQPADPTSPLIIRARGSISVLGLTQLNASGNTPGAGGNPGGAGGPAGVGETQGEPGSGPGGGLPNGGGGGFANKGGGASGGPIAGQPQISSHETNRGSGGAGGNGTTLVAGGRGGASGGSIELSAGGTLTVGAIEAKGSSGTNGANVGGAGSGGLVLLRGTQITTGTLTVSGGTTGSPGSVGRIRMDVPAGTLPASTPMAYRGPMFDAATPLITRKAMPMLKVVGQPSAAFGYVILDETRNTVKGPFLGSVAPSGSNIFPVEMPLFRGLNTICTQVDGGSDVPEARNCIDIVYLFEL